jgi:hypothetical protein
MRGRGCETAVATACGFFGGGRAAKGSGALSAAVTAPLVPPAESSRTSLALSVAAVGAKGASSSSHIGRNVAANRSKSSGDMFPIPAPFVGFKFAVVAMNQPFDD